MRTFVALSLAAAVAVSVAHAQQKPEPPKTVFKEVTDQFAKLPQHEVRVVTAPLPPGVSGGWHTHPAPVYVYLSQGQAALELENGTFHDFKAGEVIVEPADTVMRTVNRSPDEPAFFVTFQVSDPSMAFAHPVER